jgi:CRISPR-associated endonuclease/helicase Cas3
MEQLTPADFENYFHELHGHDRSPYDWQSRLAGQVVAGRWPGTIDLPTGSGKTSCLDIAVFALSCQVSWKRSDRTAPRRIFFCVNRRVIVDEASRRGEKIARAIWQAERDADDTKPTLRRVAHALRSISSLTDPKNRPPLDVLELRGGIYRDNRWARSATQPTIVCTTIDQLGSRLLFRGYGVSPNAAPVQAALIAYDSLVLLDEAHISRPFLQTLESVKRYLDPRRWAKQPLGISPMVVVPMTATPPEGVSDTDVIRLGPKDRENRGLDNRLKAAKWAKLLSVSDLTQAATTEAESLAKDRRVAVGVIVNRVATAKAIYERLRAAHPDAVVELVIGSMRPVDRDRQAERLRQLVGPDRPNVTTATSFVVATQCLEVGADYDFDALVTECASLDALRQRFGRLNRGGRDIDATGVILIQNEQVKKEEQPDKDEPLDPIYGNALPRTWNWLRERADVIPTDASSDGTATRRRRGVAHLAAETHRINFGIDAFNDIIRDRGDEGRIPTALLSPSACLNAPVMLPSYVDFWTQTSPHPTPDPEVALFIHGPQSGEPDVQVCWRADLVEDDRLKRTDWCDVVGLLAPTAAECMSVPISRVRRWLTDESDNPDQGDLLGAADAAPSSGPARGGKRQNQRRLTPSRVGVLWRGSREGESKVIDSPDELRPGDTLVLPASAEGWDELGHVPQSAPIDIAEVAFRTARDRAVMRLHPSLRQQLPDSASITALLDRISSDEEPATQRALRQCLSEAADGFGTERPEQAQTCRDLANPRLGLIRETYPDECGVVLMTRRRLGSTTDWYLPVVDEGEDDRSRTTCGEPIRLDEHTRHVREEVVRTIDSLMLDEFSGLYRRAADLHDLGKADDRFQAMLRRTDRTDAWLLAGMASVLLAKSDGMPQTPQQRREARERAELPEGFRHEMLSVQIAVHGGLVLADDKECELALHLIAAHHGYARPFAPVVADDEPPDVTVNAVTLAGSTRAHCPPHRLDSGIADRFWTLTRRYGWWGLAYLEAILRLADQQASADEDAGNFADHTAVELTTGAGT